MGDRTLIIGPSWVGDMVMAQALFKAIKQHYPHTQIDVLAPDWSRPLTERMPEIANSISMPFKHGELKLSTRYRVGKKLKQQYQRCFVCPNSFKSALIPFWANIPERIGYRREGRGLILTNPIRLDKNRFPKMVQRYVALVDQKNATQAEQLYQPSLRVEPESVKAALAAYQLTLDKPRLVLCPGAEFGPSKRWPATHYAKLANEYLAKGWQVWVFGSAKDTPVAQEIASLCTQPLVDLTGRTSLAQAIDLMSCANKVVTNDSGLMHIAAALGRPLVAIYGSTSPDFTPPLHANALIVREQTPCSPCFARECRLKHHDCMQKLSVEKVVQAAETLSEV